jgi:hypothetical protein
MSIRNKIVLYSALACAVLALAPATAAAAKTGAPAIRSGPDAPSGYITVSNNGISVASNAEMAGEATCPQGTVVLGGGAYIKSTSVELAINDSQPVPGSSGDDSTWYALVNNFSGAATTFNVYAVCATTPPGYEQVVGKTVNNPAGDQDSGTVSCPAGDVVLGGGASNTGGISFGMASSYPSSRTSWTAAVSNFSGRDGEFAPVAVCALAYPGYTIVSTSASDPAGVQKGIIQDCPSPAVVLGGGNESSNTANLRIEMKTTQPFPVSGTSWKSGENNDTSAGTTLTSYAVCAT